MILHLVLSVVVKNVLIKHGEEVVFDEMKAEVFYYSPSSYLFPSKHMTEFAHFVEIHALSKAASYLSCDSLPLLSFKRAGIADLAFTSDMEGILK